MNPDWLWLGLMLAAALAPPAVLLIVRAIRKRKPPDAAPVEQAQRQPPRQERPSSDAPLLAIPGRVLRRGRERRWGETG